MHIQRIQNAVLQYAEQNIMPRYNAGLMRFGAWFILGTELARLEQLFRTQFAGTLIDGDEVKWEEVKTHVGFAFDKEGKLPVGNIVFDKNDWEQFVKIVEKA